MPATPGHELAHCVDHQNRLTKIRVAIQGNEFCRESLMRRRLITILGIAVGVPFLLSTSASSQVLDDGLSAGFSLTMPRDESARVAAADPLNSKTSYFGSVRGGWWVRSSQAIAWVADPRSPESGLSNTGMLSRTYPAPCVTSADPWSMRRRQVRLIWLRTSGTLRLGCDLGVSGSICLRSKCTSICLSCRRCR